MAMTYPLNTSLCPECQCGTLIPLTLKECFYPHGEEVTVELASNRCEICGHETPTLFEHEDNERRLRARKPHYGALLLGEEILAMRLRHGLSPALAAQLFGQPHVTFTDFERETAYPDEATTLLLTMAIEQPESVRWLAARAGIALPATAKTSAGVASCHRST